MAKIRLTSPTFNAAAKTVTHASFSDVTLAGIQLIVNVTDQIIIYNFADTTKGGSLTGDVLTLEYDTTTMSDTDELMVLVEDGVAYQLPTGAATAANQASILAAVDGLEALLGTIDADTGAILLAVDTIETLIGSTNTKLDTVIGHVDGIESTLSTIDGRVDGLETSNSAIQTAVEKLDNVVQTEGAVYVQGDTAIVAGVRKDSTGAPAGVADGDVHPFIFNEEGRLKTSTQPAIYTPTTGTITANGQTVSADVSRASNIMFHCTGTFSTINVAFEGSIDGGTTWFAVQAVRSNANTVETTTGNLSATPAYAWEASVNALTDFRVRATAYTSGTQTWRILPGAYATEPIPAAQVSATQPVSGTVTANVGTGTNTIQNLIPTTVADVASAAITTTTTTATFTPTAGLGYQLSIPVTAVSGTNPLLVITIEESLDSGTNWFPRCTFRCAATPNATSTATGIYYSPYLKLKGNRVRYVQTITGTSPSITRAINRFQGQSDQGEGVPYKLISAATTNATLVKAGPTTVSMLTVTNINAAVRYLKIYDKATAPTVGTDEVSYTYAIPGNTAGSGITIPLARELNLMRGFGLALTTGAADSDTGAVAANEIIINCQIS